MFQRDGRTDTPVDAPAGPTPRLHLSVDLILDAAMRIADTRGMDALTMRTLGAELGVDPTAAYRYFRTKDELVLALFDRYTQRIGDAWSPTGHWREDLAALSRAMRRGLMAQPAMAQAYLSTPTKTLHSNFLSDRGLDVLVQAGLSGRDLIVTYQLFEDFVLGGAMLDGTFYPHHWEVRLERYRQWTSGRAIAVAPDAASVESIAEEAFEVGLQALLDHVERLVNR